MAFITIFSAPKPFADPHIATIQRNAIHSWTQLADAEVILLGAEQGMAQVAEETGVKYLPTVKCNANGTPLVSSMFQLARENSTSHLLCIVNADMILMDDFVVAVRQVQEYETRFVLLSQRWDLNLTGSIDFKGDWQARLRPLVSKQGHLHRPAGSDFFLFPRACYTDIPDFAIGRAGWDNWMIYKARKEKWPVIDCTPSIMIVHQNHDYRHLPGGKSHHEHPETNANIRLAGGQAAIRYTVLDATHCLVDGRLVRPAFSAPRFWRGVELLLRKLFFFLPENLLEDVVRPRRWKKRIKKVLGNR